MSFKKIVSHLLFPARFVFFGKTAAEHQAEMSSQLSELEAQAEGDKPKEYKDVKGEAESKLTAHISTEKGKLEGLHTGARRAEKAEVTALEEKIKAAKGDEKTKLEGELAAKKAAHIEAEAARVKEKQELDTNLEAARKGAITKLQDAYRVATEKREKEAEKEVPRLMAKVVQERAKRKARRAEKRREDMDELSDSVEKDMEENDIGYVIQDYESCSIPVDPSNKSELSADNRTESIMYLDGQVKAVTKSLLIGIYIAEGPRAAEKMAEQIHRATIGLDNGEDVTYDAWHGALAVDSDGSRRKLNSKGEYEESGSKNGRGSLQYTIDENVCPANVRTTGGLPTAPELVGRTWGYMYSANKLLEKDEHFDAYQEYLSQAVRKEDAEADDLMSPAEWLAENSDKLKELETETPDDPSDFLDDVLHRVDEEKTPALKSMLMAVLRTEKDPKKWDYMVSEALAKITGKKVEDLDLDDLDDVDLDVITERWGKDILEESELELSEKAKKYVAGLILGAEMKYGGDSEKMKKYQEHLQAKFKDPDFQKQLRRLDSKFRRKMAEASDEDKGSMFERSLGTFRFEDSGQMQALKEFDEDVQALLEEELEDVVTFEGVKKEEELDEEQKKQVVAMRSEYDKYKRAVGGAFVLDEFEALDPDGMKPEDATKEKLDGLDKKFREAVESHMADLYQDSVDTHKATGNVLTVMNGATAKRMSPHYASIAAKLRASYQEAVGSKAKILEEGNAVDNVGDLVGKIPEYDAAKQALVAWREEHKDDLAKVEGYFPKVDEWEKKNGITHGGKQGAPSGGGARPAPGATPGGARPAPRPAPGGSPRPAPQPAPAPSPERRGKDPEVGDPQDERPDGFQDKPVAKAPAWMGKAHEKMERPGYYVVKRGGQTLLAYRKPGHQGGEISFEHYDPEKKTG